MIRQEWKEAMDGRVWERCWCYRYGRCVVDCPTADVPRPVPMTSENWRAEYERVISDRLAVREVQE